MAMPFATLADLEAHLHRGLTGADEAAGWVALDGATEAIRALTGQALYPSASATVTLQGHGRRILRLPQAPVTAVASVTVDGTLVALTTDYRWLADGSLIGYPGWALGAQVAVTYTYGYATVPVDLKLLCVRMAAAAWENPSGVSAESVGSYSVTYGTAPDPAGASKAILDRYRPALLP